MEASDAFAQQIDGSDDPFAGTDLADDAASFGEEPSEDIPVVDREGHPVEEAQEAPEGAQGAAQDPPTSSASTSESAPPSSGSPSEVAADPTPPAESAGPTEDPTPPTPASGGASSSATDGEAGADPTQAPEGSPSASTPASPEGSSNSGTPTEGSSEPSSGSDEDAEPPTAGGKGAKNKRRYLLFQMDAAEKLTQVTWYEDKQGKLVAKGTPGSKRQKVCLASSTDMALKFAYAAVGAPEGGVKLVAVAQLHFQPREVKPMPPQPLRQRLQIS